MMELFKTTGILNEPILQEVAGKGIPKSGKWGTIIYFASGIMLSVAGYPAYAAVVFSIGLFLALWFFVLWQLILFKRITIKRELRNLQEFSGTLGYQYTTWFDEDVFVVWNQTNHGTEKFQYTFLKRMLETEHIFAVQTKNKQFVPIFKSGLSSDEVEELPVFLKTRNGNIKIYRLK